MTIAEGTEITLADVEAIGDVDDALRDFYDQQVVAAAAATGVTERAIRDWVEQELITDGGFRGQALQGPLGADGADLVPMTLQNGHLLRAESRRGTNWYEIAHDRMVEPIIASNVAWRAIHLNPLQVAAIDWDAADRPGALLLTGVALDDARDWAAANETDLSDLDRDFLVESDAAAAAIVLEGKRKRRNRAFLAAAVVAALLAGIAVVVAMSANSELSRARGEANEIIADADAQVAAAREDVRFAELNLAEKQAEADQIAASLGQAEDEARAAEELADEKQAEADLAVREAAAAQVRADNARAEAEAAVQAEIDELERQRADEIERAEELQAEAERLAQEAEDLQQAAEAAQREADRAQDQAAAAQQEADLALRQAADAKEEADLAFEVAGEIAEEAARLEDEAEQARADAQAELDRLANLEAELADAEQFLDDLIDEIDRLERDTLSSLFAGLQIWPGAGSQPGSLCVWPDNCPFAGDVRDDALPTVVGRIPSNVSVIGGPSVAPESRDFVVAATLGSGKAVIFGHDGVLHDVVVDPSNDNLVFFDNAARWAIRETRACSAASRVVLVRGYLWMPAAQEIQAIVQRRGWGAITVIEMNQSMSELQSALACADLVIYGNDWLPAAESRDPAAEADAIADFVANGGGLVLGGLGWSYRAQGERDWSEYRSNQLATRFGVAFTQDVYDSTTITLSAP